MKKKDLDQLRKDYVRVTGREPAIRWNKQTLEKKMLDAEILAAGYAAKDRELPPVTVGEPNPDFEKLASEPEMLSSDPAVPSLQEVPRDGRGGPREGAGRPTGQTDRRARCERVMAVEVPDLAVAVAVDGLNTGLRRMTGVGIDDKPAAKFEDMPHGSDSLALGLTKLLYFWFPSLEGRSDIVTLHLQALYLIVNPFRERAERVHELIKQKEAEHAKEAQNPQGPISQSEPAAPAAPVEQPSSNRVKPASHTKGRVKARNRRK